MQTHSHVCAHADIPALKRWAASKVVGDLPSATFDEALAYFQRAAGCYVGADGSVGKQVWCVNALWTAKTLLRMSNKTAATAEVKRALEFVDALPASQRLPEDDLAAVEELKQLQADHRLR
jgi:hypothetical protein